MIVNYKTLLFGERAAEFGKNTDEVYGRMILNYADVCCPTMSDYLNKPENDQRSRFDIGYNEPDHLRIDVGYGYRQWAVRFCPFCGKKIEFNEIALSTQIKTKDPPQVRYSYEEKTIKAPDI